MTGFTLVTKNAGLFCQCQIRLAQLIKGGIDGPDSGDYHDIVAGEEFLLVDPVDLPQTAADTVANVGLAQLLADRDTHPVLACPVFSGIEYQIGTCLAGSAVKPLEYVIEL